MEVITNSSVNEVNMSLWLEEDVVLSPKLNLVWSPLEYLDIYVNSGTGFHSNDARDVVISARINEIIQAGNKQGLTREEIDQELNDRYMDPSQADMQTLPRAKGAELGMRLRLGNRVLLSAAGWYLNMEEELVYVGDAGTTEVSGETNRIGVDLEIRAQLASLIPNRGYIMSRPRYRSYIIHRVIPSMYNLVYPLSFMLATA